MLIFINALKRFVNEKYMDRAAALSFNTILALVPLLAVIMFFITLFPIFSDAVDLAKVYILKNFLPTSAATIEYYFHMFILQAIHLPSISIIFLLFSCILLVNTIEDTLNQIWEVPTRRFRIGAAILYVAIILLAPLMLGWIIFVTSYVSVLPWLAQASEQLGVNTFIIFYFPIFMNTCLFALLYLIVPNARVCLRDALLGGFVAAMGCELSRICFAYYVDQFRSYELIYGTFAIVPIFLLWIYICWMVILYGALIVCENRRFRNLIKH